MSIKQPNWNDYTDRKNYVDLFYNKKFNELTEEKQEFCKTMYLCEEYSCGLDG